MTTEVMVVEHGQQKDCPQHDAWIGSGIGSRLAQRLYGRIATVTGSNGGACGAVAVATVVIDWKSSPEGCEDAEGFYVVAN